MVRLIITDNGLRRGYDPGNPKLQDIRLSYRLAQIAHEVIAATPLGRFVLKGRRESTDVTEVTFNGSIVLDVGYIANSYDESIVSKMQSCLSA